MSLNCIVDPAIPNMEPFIDNKIPYMYVDNVKEHSDPVLLLRSVIVIMKAMIKHCSSNNSDNFGENLKKYMIDIKNSLRIYGKLLKNHKTNGDTLTELKDSLDVVLERMEKDEKKSRDDEYHPTPKKFKPNDPGNGHENDSLEYPENIRASTISRDNIRASNSIATTDAGIIPLIQL